MIKKNIFKNIFIITILYTTLNITAFAAPAYLTGNEKSNANLIQIYKPINDTIIYNDSKCTISGCVNEYNPNKSLNIVIYKYDVSSNTYIPLKNEGKTLDWNIESKFFIEEISLVQSSVNHIIIYAESEDKYQLVFKEVSTKATKLSDFLNRTSVNFIEKMIKKIY